MRKLLKREISACSAEHAPAGTAATVTQPQHQPQHSLTLTSSCCSGVSNVVLLGNTLLWSALASQGIMSVTCAGRKGTFIPMLASFARVQRAQAPVKPSPSNRSQPPTYILFIQPTLRPLSLAR